MHSILPKLLLVLACASPLLQGCTSVPPWKRGVLARPDMAVTPNPELARLRDHVFVSKEGASGGRGATGGGCGCN